ncbi:MAG: 3-hydroxyacyl-ACP dehydratase FabZ [Pirellulales bacterium]
MSLEQIHAAIPHRAPFLLLDEIISCEDRHIVCRKTFAGDEFWFQGHYPGYPLMPGVLLCEAAMQAAAVLLSQHITDSNGKVPVATRLKDVRFRKMVRPGDTIDIEVELKDVVSGAFFLHGRVTVGDQLAVRCEFACMMASPQ